MKRYAIYLNVFLWALLGYIAWREAYLPRLWRKLFPDNSLAYYTN